MNSPALRLMMCLSFLICGFARPVPSPAVRGQITVNPHLPAKALPARLRILLKAGGLPAGNTLPDSAGRFSFDWPKIGDSIVDLFCVAPGLDTMFLQSLPFSAAGSAEKRFLFPCEPDTTASGDIICPKCSREDQVYPMTYGDPITITRHFDTAGKVSYERTPKKETQTDTVVRAARFYCRRDKITF